MQFVDGVAVFVFGGAQVGDEGIHGGVGGMRQPETKFDEVEMNKTRFQAA